MYEPGLLDDKRQCCNKTYPRAEISFATRLYITLCQSVCRSVWGQFAFLAFWAADPKGTMSYRTRGNFCPSVRPSKRTNVHTNERPYVRPGPKGSCPPPTPAPQPPPGSSPQRPSLGPAPLFQASSGPVANDYLWPHREIFSAFVFLGASHLALGTSQLA